MHAQCDTTRWTVEPCKIMKEAKENFLSAQGRVSDGEDEGECEGACCVSASCAAVDLPSF